MPRSYALPQILLHWIVALLVLAQFLNDDAIGAAWRAFRRGDPAPSGILATVHVLVGIAILALVAWRIALRFTRGAPPPPDEETLLLRAVATGTHLLLYLALILLPVSGLLAWFGGVGSAIGIHRAMKTVLLALVALHVAGALYQHFILRGEGLARMTRPDLPQDR